MDRDALKGLTVFVAEDEYMMAADLERELVDAGARVLGPVSSLEATLDLIGTGQHIDAAILDVNLQGNKVFPAAEVLQQQGVPFMFATGYDQSIIPARFQDVLRCEKPIGTRELTRIITTIIDKRPSS